MDNINKDSLTRKEMEEMLPDFVFERLDQVDADLFENSLPNFPDLIDEIAHVKRVFSDVEKIDFNKIIDSRARNLSVCVLRRRQNSRSSNVLTKGRFYRVAMPLMALIALGFIIFQQFDNNEKMQIEYKPQLVKASDVAMLVDSTVSTKDVIDASLENDVAAGNEHELVKTEGDSKLIDQLLADELITNKNDNSANEILRSNVVSENKLLDGLDTFDENDLQDIIEVLSHVDITKN